MLSTRGGLTMMAAAWSIHAERQPENISMMLFPSWNLGTPRPGVRKQRTT